MRYDEFIAITTSLKETSKDPSRPDAYMTELEHEVINFDEVKNRYLRDLNPRPCDIPLSNDALIKKDDKWIFIEFKNGVITNRENGEVKMKLFESILMFLDLIDKTIEYSRQNVIYVLVFNEQELNHTKVSSKFDRNEYLRCNQIPSMDSPSFADIISGLDELAGNLGRAQFDLERYENYIFKNVYTVPKYKFNNFISRYFD